MRVLSKAAAVVLSGVLSGVLLTSCSGEGGDAGGSGSGEATEQSRSASPSMTAEPKPELGGAFGRREKGPAKPMDELEKPIADQLRNEIDGQGLKLNYLDCPKWNGKAPQRMTCEAYLSGVTADVRVRLTKSTTRVNFDAELQNGVLATTNLVRQLEQDGYENIDCGDRDAYPTRKGLELTCSVEEGGKQKYVVATVLNRSGAVSISDY